MSDIIRQAIRTLEQEREALDQRHAELTRAIEAIRPLTGEPDDHDERTIGARVAPRRPRSKAVTRKPRASTPAPAARGRAGDDDRVGRVLAALRVKSPQSPGELERSAKLTFATTSQRTHFFVTLARAGGIVRRGNGRGATIALPGKTPAKEAP